MDGISGWCDASWISASLVTPQRAPYIFRECSMVKKMQLFKEWIAKNPLDGYLAPAVTSVSSPGKGKIVATWRKGAFDQAAISDFIYF
ncbi:MAG: hypothetical protein LBF22_09110 [Deltaproteobacteria bacterium]|nr:hypothetical protein [Deltaproteobacteria bacterium]